MSQWTAVASASGSTGQLRPLIVHESPPDSGHSNDVLRAKRRGRGCVKTSRQTAGGQKPGALGGGVGYLRLIFHRTGL
jgi:hypothetical protein